MDLGEAIIRQITPGLHSHEAREGDRVRAMNEAAPSPSGDFPRAKSLDFIEVFALLGSESRWPIMRLLADGKPRTATQVAAVLNRDFDGVSKHLRLMREAGLLECQAGEDRRYLLFYLPEAYRRVPGVLDFGVCTIRLP